jgi:DedD protein
MERQLLERMIGAAVLIIALIVVVPAILDGNGPAEFRSGGGTGQDMESGDVRTQTVRLNETGAVAPPVSRPGDLPPVTAPDAPRRTPAIGPNATVSEPATRPAAPTLPLASGARGERSSATAAPARTAAEKAPLTEPAAPAGSKSAAAAGSWVVQVGTFGQKDNADRLITKLRASGYEAFASPSDKAGRTLYRVRVGPEDQRAKAESLAARLAAAGHHGQVVAQ